jgi:hypothetical protein
LSSLRYATLSFQLLAGLLPIVYLFYSKKKFISSFLYFLIFSLFSTTIIIILKNLKVHNLWVFKFYAITSFLCLMHYFYKVNGSKLKLPLIFSILFSSVFIVENFFYAKINYTLYLMNFLVITSCIIYFIYETKNYSKINFVKSINVINVAFLLFVLTYLFRVIRESHLNKYLGDPQYH